MADQHLYPQGCIARKLRQGPGATLAGAQLLPADAREINHRDLARGGNSCRQAAIDDAAQPERRTLLVI